MPKVSKATASSHSVFPGYGEMHDAEIGDWNVSFGADYTDFDETPLYKGAPGDMCQAHHIGYVFTGTLAVRKADGTEETYEAGDAFVIEPGHVPLVSAGSEYLVFTPKEEARQQMAVMMPNIVAFAKEHGIELPEQLAPA